MDKKQIIKLQVLIDQYKEIRSEYFEEGNMPYNNYTQIYKDTLQLMDEIIMKADQLTEQGGESALSYHKRHNHLSSTRLEVIAQKIGETRPEEARTLKAIADSLNQGRDDVEQPDLTVMEVVEWSKKINPYVIIELTEGQLWCDKIEITETELTNKIRGNG